MASSSSLGTHAGSISCSLQPSAAHWPPAAGPDSFICHERVRRLWISDGGRVRDPDRARGANRFPSPHPDRGGGRSLAARSLRSKAGRYSGVPSSTSHGMTARPSIRLSIHNEGRSDTSSRRPRHSQDRGKEAARRRPPAEVVGSNPERRCQLLSKIAIPRTENLPPTAAMQAASFSPFVLPPFRPFRSARQWPVRKCFEIRETGTSWWWLPTSSGGIQPM